MKVDQEATFELGLFLVLERPGIWKKAAPNLKTLITVNASNGQAS